MMKLGRYNSIIVKVLKMKSYSKLIQIINVAVTNKPNKGDNCNNCGWCCLTEVCTVGIELTGSSVAPCKLLASSDSNKHYCKLADNDITRAAVGIGSGCCA